MPKNIVCLVLGWLLVAALLAGGPPAVGAEPTETAKQLVGSWVRGADPWETLRFTADGQYHFTRQFDGGPRSNRQERGTWRFTEKGELELKPTKVEFLDEGTTEPAPPPRRYRISLKGDELRLAEKEAPWKRSK